MALSRGDLAAWGDRALWRRVVSALLLISFFWISYLSQTHIHGQPVTAATASTIVKVLHITADHALPAPAKDNSDTSADCPLCQAVSIAGAAIIPLLIAFLLIQNVVLSVLPRAAEHIWTRRFGFAHQTRGPPSL